MPDPAELLAVARLLLSADPLSDAHLRRAVSTAYYAVFHAVSVAGAERFVGAGMRSSPSYSLLYRGFNHGRMKSACLALNVTTLSKLLQEQLGRTTASQLVRDFANIFPEVQEARHAADYDPAATLTASDATDLVDRAAAAITAFHQITPDEQTDMLALMLVNPRG